MTLPAASKGSRPSQSSRPTLGETMRPIQRSFLIILLIAWLATLSACQTQRTVLIQADGQSRLVTVIRAETVGDALEEAGLTLGEKDRVTPDIYARLPRSGSISVVRVTERTEMEVEAVPFQREILRDESVQKGETRLVRAGAQGQRQRTYRVTLEDGVPVRRELVEDRISLEPVSEVLQVGTQGSLAAVPISGTLAYLSGGNAWVARSSTGNKRPVTFSGDLDGRVFALAPTGGNLAFSRRPVPGTSGINTLWLVDTLLAADQPLALDQPDVLYADWRGNSLLFSTGQATAGAPGWKANNDLWLLPSPGRPRQALPSTGSAGVYAWWGRSYALSPNGKSLAYATASEVGVLDLLTGSRQILASFAPVNTASDWVWTPGLSWKPDGSALAAVVHAPSPAGQPPEDSPAFDLWVFPREGPVGGAAGTRLAAGVGMWAMPSWSPDGSRLTYGVAQDPAASAASRYDLTIMDVDHSSPRPLLTSTAWGGLQPQRVAWSPQGNEVVVSYQGDLYLVSLAGGPPRALTDDGRSSNPVWR